LVLDSVFGVGMDSDFGFLNMKIRNLGAGHFNRGSRLRLGAGLNWENFSSENKIILILRKTKKRKKRKLV
jgi:hypothetical protein